MFLQTVDLAVLGSAFIEMLTHAATAGLRRSLATFLLACRFTTDIDRLESYFKLDYEQTCRLKPKFEGYHWGRRWKRGRCLRCIAGPCSLHVVSPKEQQERTAASARR